uniref:Uncharacterized protein n=1 Tax=Triticum urartu TaxID=4572 RepID=A0A8R7TTE3_TRIUA
MHVNTCEPYTFRQEYQQSQNDKTNLERYLEEYVQSSWYGNFPGQLGLSCYQ